ncbi:MAG: DUF4255 domain-containing protein [Nitrosomonas sp.]|nr:MAG: DUF4255 domain-containing protein [Nitrosomonas sp.]
MSNSNALATVTATLKGLIEEKLASDPHPDPDISGAKVTVSPPSVARSINANSGQINIFLYSTQHNSAFSNFPMPGEAKNGERAYPPLSLILKYLITVYGVDDNDISGQKLMGKVMSLLHDNPVLERSDIDNVEPDSGLHRQIERVRITPDSLSLDDMSKLWSSFQSAEYRLSTSYQVSVVLIESLRIQSAPLPVLKRGKHDQGGTVTAAPLPVLTGFRFSNQRPGAELGDTVTLLGERLTGDETIIRLQHPLLVEPTDSSVPQPIDLRPETGGTASELTFKIPSHADDAAIGSKWPAGFYAVSLVIQRPDTPSLTSNALSMPLSPTIATIKPTSAPAGDVELTIECLPQIRPDQRVMLLFGDQMIQSSEINTPANPSAPSTMKFSVVKAQTRSAPYIVRLRIDGVDSIPVDFSGNTPQFAANQMVTIT